MKYKSDGRLVPISNVTMATAPMTLEFCVGRLGYRCGIIGCLYLLHITIAFYIFLFPSVINIK